MAKHARDARAQELQRLRQQRQQRIFEVHEDNPHFHFAYKYIHGFPNLRRSHDRFERQVRGLRPDERNFAVTELEEKLLALKVAAAVRDKSESSILLESCV